jgi:hypothetical protein
MWKWAIFSFGVIGLAWCARAADDPTGPRLERLASPPAAAREESAAPQQTTTSRITHVTVYPNSALVTREVDVPEGNGSMELVVTPLPVQTVNSSLYSEGSDGIRVLATRFRSRPVREDTREEVRKLQDQMKQLHLQVQKLDADIKTAEMNLQMVSKLENFTAASTQHATEKGTLNADTIIALSKHVMDQRAEKSKELVALQQQRQEKQEEIDYAGRQLKDLTAGQSKTERDAVIVLDKTNKTAGKVRLNYLVDAALWRPQYKLRAGREEKEAVQVEYLAAVVQQTGEDWTNIRMTLSTAQPMLNAAPPELKMLEVSVMPRGANPVADNNFRVPNPPGNSAAQFGALGGGFGQFGQQGGGIGGMPGGPGGQPALAQQLDSQARSLRAQAAAEYNSKKDSIGGRLVNEAAALEQANDLLNADDRVAPKGKPVARGSSREGPSVTYHLKTRLSLPSRNDEQVLEVTRIEMAPEYFYKAVPVLSPHVYRLATLTNKSDYVLLPGEATMYQETDFVGRMDLPLVAIGEQFTIGFGADPQLQVHRQMIEKSRTMQGGNQVLKYEYRILLSSYKAQPVTLQLWDRLPLAEDQSVGVTLVRATPEISKDPIYEREQRPRNLLRWDLKIDPAMSGEKALAVQYDFKVELDKQMAISTFAAK